MEPVERLCPAAGRMVRCLEGGSGQPCVLLHAFPLSADMWRPQLEDPPSGWRLLAPDLRGFRGPSSAPVQTPTPPPTMDDYARDVLALMDALSLPSAVVCGLSMGGYVAFAMWRLAPGRIRGFVLADTRAGADSDEARARRRVMLDLLAREGPGRVATEMLPGLLGRTTHKSRPELVTQVRDLIEANAPEAIAAAIGALMERPDSTSQLSQMCVPGKLIAGAEDTLTPPELAGEMQQLLPDADLTIIEEAGHLSNLEAPGLFNTALAEFLWPLTTDHCPTPNTPRRPARGSPHP
jgi:3-oxoadipate enol-lactonase